MFSKSIVLVLAIVAGLTVAAPTASSSPGSGFSKRYVTSPPLRSPLSLTHSNPHRQTGLGTIFLQNGGTGSCGQVNPESALIVALGDAYMNYESPSSYCGRTIQVTNVGSNSGTGGAGNSVTVTVADTCAACDANHLDFSVGAWNALTNGAEYGTINIDWSVLSSAT